MRWQRASACLTVLIGLLGSPATAVADPDRSPAFDESRLGGRQAHPADVIEQFGDDCATKTLHVGLYFPPGVAGKSVEIDADENCLLTAGPIRTVLSPTATATAGADSLLCDPFHSGNIIHTSHTIQDRPNIDLAWLRSKADRNWDHCSSWFPRNPGRGQATWAGTGPVWWGTPFGPAQWSYKPAECAAPNGRTYCEYRNQAIFSTAFPLCVLPGSDTTFVVTTYIFTYRDGGSYVDWVRVGSCRLEHSATGAYTNTNWAADYGGSGAKVYA